MQTDFNPEYPLLLQGARLYILARTDIPQMNPGKGWAHGGHVGTQFVFDVLDLEGDHGLRITEQMHEWRAQGGGGFGTKITLALTKSEILETVEHMRNEFGLQTGTVVDPTYPMTNYFGDGFTAEELTGGYVFAPSNTPATALDYLKQFDLHR